MENTLRIVTLGLIIILLSQTILALPINKIKSSPAEEIKPIVKIFDENSKKEKINEIKKFGKKKTLIGELDIIIHDDFENQKSETEYSLSTNEGEYIVYADDSIASQLNPSVTINIESLAIGNEIVPIEASPIENFKAKQSTRNPNLGNQRLAVILVNFVNNNSTPSTKEEIYNKVFNNNPGLNSYIKEASYDRAYITGNVFGWYTLPFNSEDVCLQGGFNKLLNASMNSSNNEINFSEYDHIMMITTKTGCSSSANLGRKNINTPDGIYKLSASRINSYSNLLGFRETAHEFGHQLGLGHANGWECGNTTIGDNCSSLGYRDVFDVMGYGNGEGHYNSFHKEALGWLKASEIIEVKKEGIYTLNPLELSNGVKILKIPTSNNFHYSIEYRRPIGYDSFLPSVNAQPYYGENVYNGAIIHTNVTNRNIGYDTQLLDTTPNSIISSDPWADFSDSVLSSGKVFVDSVNNISIKTLRPGKSLHIEICFTKNCLA